MERYADCARTMGIAAAGDENAKAAALMVEAIYRRNEELEVPTPKQYGIAEEEYFAKIPLMAEQALASGSPQNNPRIPTAQEIEAIYRVCWPPAVGPTRAGVRGTQISESRPGASS